MIKGSMNLAALKHVVMEKTGKEGKPVKGIFVPLDANSIQQHENGGMYLNVVAFPMRESKEWATHIVKQSLKKEVREAMSEEEKQAVPILGNLKVADSTPQAQNNDAGEGRVYDEDSGLPF